jgi:hypothetical protein
MRAYFGHWTESSGQSKDAAALTPGKSDPMALKSENMLAPEPVWMYWKEKMLVFCW